MEQAARWEPRYLMGRTALSLADVDGGLEVTLSTGERVRAAALLITAGIGTFEPRPLPVGRRAFLAVPSASKVPVPLYTGTAWFLPFAGAYYRMKDRLR